MSKRLKAIIIIEIVILIGLLFHVIRTPHMWMMVLLALLFTYLANRSRSKALRIISIVFWATAAMVLFTVGWFWAAIFFPALMCIIFWKNNPRSDNRQAPRKFYESFYDQPISADETVTKANGNDIIDLASVHYRHAGNHLSIKKNTGNTKIIVPEDVAVILDISVGTGVVKIFNEAAKINTKNIRYFSDHLGDYKKKIKITIDVQTGNVEIVQG